MSLPNSQTITCRGAVCWGLGEGLKAEEIRVEPPRKDEVRVRMLLASFCHTDILFMNGFPQPQGNELFPRVVGHEGVGVVESVGEGVTTLKEGDTVIPTFLGECKDCINCSSNKTNVCLRYSVTMHGLMPDNTSRMSVRGQKLYHAFTCSTFSEFTVMNVNYALRIESRVPLPHASILSCGFTTGFGAAWKVADVEKGSSVAVLGLGTVGLGAISGSKLLRAAKIIGVDLNSARRDPAKNMGMTDFINPRDLRDQTISDAIKEITNGLGADYSFECTGVKGLLGEAMAATSEGKGVTIVLGADTDTKATVDLLDLLAGKTLKGCMFGGIKTQSDLPNIFSKCADGELPLDGLVTHEVELSDIHKAVDMLKDAKCLKLIVKIA